MIKKLPLINLTIGLFYVPMAIILTNNVNLIAYEDFKSILLIPLVPISFLLICQFIMKNHIDILKPVCFILVFNILISFINKNELISYKFFILINSLIILLYFFTKKFILKKYLKFLLICTYLFISFSFLNYFYLKKDFNKQENNKIFISNNFNNLKLKHYPNIYHIIPDGLTNIKNHPLENQKMIKKITEDNQLDIFTNSTSNYPNTFLSLPSLLNGSLFLENLKFYENQFNHTIKNSAFHNFLLKNNYKIFWYKTKWLGSKCNKKYQCMNSNIFENEITKSYLKIFNISIRWFPKLKYSITKKLPVTHLDLVHKDLDKINKFSNPKYVFAYMNLPHSPYSVNQNCYPIYLLSIQNSSFTENQYYHQVNCLFLQIDRLVKKIKQFDKNPLIIIQSDTGWSFSDNPDPKKPKVKWKNQQFENFIAASSNFNCIKKNKIISNADFLLSILNCHSSSKITNLKNNTMYDAYYDDHPKTGLLYKRNN